MDEFGGSVGGGGRYDEMIGKLQDRTQVPADFLLDSKELSCCFWNVAIRFRLEPRKKAYLIEKNMPAEGILTILKQAEEEEEMELR